MFDITKNWNNQDNYECPRCQEKHTEMIDGNGEYVICKKCGLEYFHNGRSEI